MSTKRAKRCNRMVTVSHAIVFETYIPIFQSKLYPTTHHCKLTIIIIFLSFISQVDGSSTGAAKKSVREECPSFCNQWCRCTDWNHKIPIKIKGNKKRRFTCPQIAKKGMCDFNTEKRIRGKKLKGKELCPTSCAVDECA